MRLSFDIRPPRLLGLTLVALVAALFCATGIAAAKGRSKEPSKAYLPAKGKIFSGISDTGQTSDYRKFRNRTKAHPAVMQSFESWGYYPKEAISRWDDTNTRGMLSLSTSQCWGCDGVISPKSIAEGKGDRYILALARGLAKRKKPTYIRLFPEMNGYWNDYSAFHGSGKPRDDAYSTTNFTKAWKRFVLISRGGPRKAVEHKLRKQGMPKIRAKTKRKLPQPKLAFAWVPQSAGSPNIAGNQPADYFPGYNYVDWVGVDIYSKFPNFAGLNAVYKKFDRAPFLIGEWAPWGVDNPAFVNTLFNWIEGHSRARMAVYYQGFGEGADNPYEITDYPQSLDVLRNVLNSKRYAPFTPEAAKAKQNKGKKGKGKKGGGR